MEKYNISGMSCAACSSRVEKEVSKVSGVVSCSVNLLTNTMQVSGSYNENDIINAVKLAGYGITKSDTVNMKRKENENDLSDKETPVIKRRLIWSLVFLIALMYFSMGHMVGIPLPHYFSHNHIALGLIQLILSTAVMIINGKFFINGIKGFIHRAPNMDTLVALGSLAAYVYSLYALFKMSDAYINSDLKLAENLIHEFYFESAAMILTLITVGKMLESHSKGKTTDALKSLMKLAPVTANIIIDGKETTIPIEDIKKGDIFIVRAGETIPVDGIVINGEASVNEAALTGESIPLYKVPGEKIWAATINTSGYIECEALRIGEDTTFSQIIKMVSDAAATKAPITKIADKVSSVFVPVVIAIAFITLAIWLILDKEIGFALARGISVLVISCPCALGLATPVAVMVGSGMGAKNGILFKTATSIEITGKVKNVVLDKTGTITKGKPVVTDIFPIDDITEDELLKLAYSLEIKSEHPLADAIIKKAEEKGISAYSSSNFKTYSGNGVSAEINGDIIFAGNLKHISEKANINNAFTDLSKRLSDDGKTPLFFADSNSFLGIIAVSDEIKEDSKGAIAQLKNMRIRTIMLTGDNKITANAVGKKAGVDEIISEVLPADKESTIARLKKDGITVMVGDGINDAPALTKADIGIAIGAGADVAIDAADVVLINSKLIDVPAAIRLSRLTLRNIKQNLFWAFIYNIIGIPLAAGAFIYATGWELNPMFAAAAMSLSSFSVVSNALRLNLYNIYNEKKYIKKEVKSMEKVIKVEGMMCPHCEARVKEVLEKLDDIKTAIANHKDGTVTVISDKEISFELLKETIENQGYKVIS